VDELAEFLVRLNDEALAAAQAVGDEPETARLEHQRESLLSLLEEGSAQSRQAMRSMAAAFAEHPDFQQRWRLARASFPEPPRDLKGAAAAPGDEDDAD
jgi:hypothetical protein